MANSRPTQFGLKIMLAVAVVGGLVWAGWTLFSNPVSDLVPGANSHSSADPPLDISADDLDAFQPPQDLDKFVGSAACRECHAELCESYALTGMGSSMSPHSGQVPPAHASDERTFRVKPGNGIPGFFEYEVEYGPQGQIHHERLVDDETLTEPAYDQSFPVAWVMGSGARGHSFLIQHDGLLFQSPIGWYSPRNVWDLSPGYAGKNLGFRRRIADGCIHCHAGRVAEDPDGENCFLDPAIVEASISCERCHGPARDHIAFHRSSDPQPHADPIINPATLNLTRKDAVCYQCHLSPDHRILRAGRSEYDFRPGMELSEIWAIFVENSPAGVDGQLRAVNHVDQMRLSRCFIDSGEKLTCTSCHDPHSAPKPENLVAYYADKCASCHTGGESACALPLSERQTSQPDGSCIACHMPSQSASDVGHISVTDHQIRRHSPQASTSTKRLRSDLTIFSPMQQQLSPVEQKRARGLLHVRDVIETRDPVLAEEARVLLESVIAAFRNDPKIPLALAQIAQIEGRYPDAETHAREALRLDPDSEETLVELTALYHRTSRWEEGLEYADRLLKRNPWNDTIWGRKVHMLGQLGRLDEGIEAAQQAIRVNPCNFQVHGWLAETYAVQGKTELASYHSAMHARTLPRSERDNP